MIIRVKIQIGDAAAADSLDQWGLTYVSSDNIFGAPIKERESVSYAEQNGECLDRRAVMAPFDYKVTFAILGDTRSSANTKIKRFNQAMIESTVGDVMTFHRIKILNPYKGTLICGIPQPISEAKSYWRDDLGCVVADLKIRVDKPQLCDFDYTEASPK